MYQFGEYKITGAVAVNSFGSSGSSFLESLLDCHPNIISIPGLGSRNYYLRWEEDFGGLPLEQRITMLMEKMQFWFDVKYLDWELGLDKLGENADQVAVVDKDLFRVQLKKLLAGKDDVTRGELFAAAVLAYNLCFPRELDKNNLVLVYSIHASHERYAMYFNEDFPNNRYVHMVRHYNGFLSSLYKHYKYYYHDIYLHPLIASFQYLAFNRGVHGVGNGIYGDRPYYEEVRERSRALRLEDLHNWPKETLTVLADFIGIPWHDSLLKSTYNGLTWWNRIESRKLSGFDPKQPFSSVAKETTALDRFRFKVLAAPKYAKWGYVEAANVTPEDEEVFWALENEPFSQQKNYKIPFIRIIKTAKTCSGLPNEVMHYIEVQDATEELKMNMLVNRKAWSMARSGIKKWRPDVVNILDISVNWDTKKTPCNVDVREPKDDKEKGTVEILITDINKEKHILKPEQEDMLNQVIKGITDFCLNQDIEGCRQITREAWNQIRADRDIILDVLKPDVKEWPAYPRAEGAVYWVTGYSGAGKTTVAKELVADLEAKGKKPVLLDGDELRRMFGATDGTYDEASRLKLAKMYARLCKNFADDGETVVIATISMFDEVREWNRKNIKNYKEIYLRVPLEERKKRDPKGLYAGGAEMVEGSEPKSADFVIDNYGMVTAADAVKEIMGEVTNVKSAA